ncbi:MAG: DUF4130 domain-containing protein [Methanotrichaceae archaeon]|nr:DUF4130 domain-containing protein [Methanotrichaceae archaeon]
MGRKIFCHHGQGLTKALRELESVLGSSLEENGVEEIWRIYYDSQYCPDRKNLAAFRKRMPIKAIDSAGLKHERNNNCSILDDFFCRD